MFAADYTSRIDPALLKDADVTDVLRYLCYTPVGNWKNIRQPEYDELLAAGISVTLNWEYDAHDWLTANGHDHGKTAALQAKALGYPAGCTIFGSADFDMSRAQWLASGRNYCEQFSDAVRDAGYEPGVYGPYYVLSWVRDSGEMDRFWQAGMSTSFSNGLNAGVWQGAHLRQRRQQKIGVQTVDMNDILISEWGQATKGNRVFDGWGELGAPSGDTYYTDKGPNGGLLRGLNTILADLQGEILEGGSPYTSAPRTPRFLGKKIGEIQAALAGIQNGIDALNARANTVALAPEDRDLLNRAVSALAGATPIDSDALAAITKLTDVLTELAAHLR